MTKQLIYLKKLPVMEWADWWYDANDDPDKKNLLVLLLHLLPGETYGVTYGLQRLQKALWVCLQFDVLNLMPGFRSVGVPGTSAAGEVQGEINEFSLADSFVLGVLRGLRLLQSAGLSPDEKRDILATTKGSLEFEVVTQALQTLWDEQFLGRSTTSLKSSMAGYYNESFQVSDETMTRIGMMIGVRTTGAKPTTGLSLNGINGVIYNTLNLNHLYKMMVLMILNYKMQ